jgi:hypothetical protein
MENPGGPEVLKEVMPIHGSRITEAIIRGIVNVNEAKGEAIRLACSHISDRVDHEVGYSSPLIEHQEGVYQNRTYEELSSF